ncbi:MAG: outer membrane protein assembly factor BamD [Flavobacteriales bacterium]|nr:outer membrane protein assembly factor BamD [Flavobacteriales bacterium]MBK9075591.1 outer membrane protein assembly factor BamD [Flavobacteriales bacterium]
MPITPFPRRLALGLFALAAMVILAACSEFNKALKSTDLDFKLKTAEKFHDTGKFDKAIPLLEELVALTRGTSLSERVNYLHAKSYFGMKDYTMSGYYLNNFTRTFPTSAYAEECAFLSAYCFYKNSPNYELDQTDTRAAIDAMQLFLIRYPTSELKDSCNTLIDVLRAKLEVKEWHNAEQYHTLRNYKAAGVALESFLRNWPNSRFREDALYLAAESGFLLANGSVEELKPDRIRDAIKSCDNFAVAFPQSDRSKSVEQMASDLRGQAERITKASTP